MFGFLKKTAPDPMKIEAFCIWFIRNKERIIASVENDDRGMMFAVLDEVEAQLAAAYCDGYKGQIHFEYGHNPNGKWDLNLYQMNKRFLIAATGMIAEKLNREIGSEWSVNVGK